MPRAGSSGLSRGNSENAKTRANNNKKRLLQQQQSEQQLLQPSSSSSSSTPQRSTTPVPGVKQHHSHHPGEMDISNPDIPEGLRSFLQEIAIPPPDDGPDAEEVSVAEAARRRHLQEVKAKVDTGGGGSGGGLHTHSASHSRSNSKKGKSGGRAGSLKNRRGSNLPDLDDMSNHNNNNNNSTEGSSGDESTEDEISVVAGSGSFSEYEITLLWNQCKTNFPSGRVNRLQLSQLLQQVFPKCEHSVGDRVSRTLMYVFDRGDAGGVEFRDLLLAFAMVMREGEDEKGGRTGWMFKFAQREKEDSKLGIDRDDLAVLIAHLCEVARNVETMFAMGRRKYFRKVDHERERERERENARERERRREQDRRRAEAEAEMNGTPKKDGDQMRMMSSRMVERAGANKSIKKKQHPQDGKRDSSEVLRLTDEEKKEREALAEQSRLEKEKAAEVVRMLDSNKDGFVSADGFARNAAVFEGLASSFRADELWGELNAGR